MLTETEAPARTFTPEEYFRVLDRVAVKLELVDGQILPKEGTAPLPVWVVEEILKDDFSPDQLDFQFPMATTKHGKIIMNLIFSFYEKLGREKYAFFAQDPKIYISLDGRYRIPDVTIAPQDAAQVYENDCLTNPIVVIEVLSPSNAGQDFENKLQDYKSIESVQEYWLIYQEERRAMQFVRQGPKRWLHIDYDRADTHFAFSSLDTQIEISAVYQHT